MRPPHRPLRSVPRDTPGGPRSARRWGIWLASSPVLVANLAGPSSSSVVAREVVPRAVDLTDAQPREHRSIDIHECHTCINNCVSPADSGLRRRRSRRLWFRHAPHLRSPNFICVGRLLLDARSRARNFVGLRDAAMSDVAADQLVLPSEDRARAGAWTVRTAGGHRLRVAFVPGAGTRVATVAADLGSSPTNGELVEASMFAWPMRVGDPVAIAESQSAVDYWRLNAAFFAGPQAPLADGTFGAEWVVTAIDPVDLERRRPVDEFDGEGRLTHCYHGFDHTAQPCAGDDGCCRAGHVASLDLRSAEGWWVVTTHSGTRYFIERGGFTVVRLGQDGSRVRYTSARIRPPVLVVGSGSWRIDTTDEWAQPTGVRSVRPVPEAELVELGVIRR